jgi:hypothetical protein
MGGTLQPGHDPCRLVDPYDLAEPHLQFTGHTDQTVGKHAAAHCRIQHNRCEASVQGMRKTLKATRAGEGRFHLALVIDLEMESQAVGVFSPAGDAVAVQGSSGLGEIPAHRFDRRILNW